MKQEAPTSFLPPEASQHKPDSNSRVARGLMKKTGDEGTLSTERIGGGDLLSLRLKRMKMTLMTPLWPLTHVSLWSACLILSSVGVRKLPLPSQNPHPAPSRAVSSDMRTSRALESGCWFGDNSSICEIRSSHSTSPSFSSERKNPALIPQGTFSDIHQRGS